MRYIFTTLLVFFLLFTKSICQNPGIQRISFKDSSDQYYIYKDKLFNFHDILIEINKVSVKDEFRYKPENIKKIEGPCYSIQTFKNKSIIDSLHFDNIIALGGYGDLFVPMKQPIDDYFVIMKRGDYDGRTVLVNRDGHFINLPGGLLISLHKKYILNFHEMDGCYTLNIFDIQSKRTIYNSRDQQLFIGDPDCYHEGENIYIIEQPEAEYYLNDKAILFNSNTGKTHIIKYDDKIRTYDKLSILEQIYVIN